MDFTTSKFFSCVVAVLLRIRWWAEVPQVQQLQPGPVAHLQVRVLPNLEMVRSHHPGPSLAPPVPGSAVPPEAILLPKRAAPPAHVALRVAPGKADPL